MYSYYVAARVGSRYLRSRTVSAVVAHTTPTRGVKRTKPPSTTTTTTTTTAATTATATTASATTTATTTTSTTTSTATSTVPSGVPTTLRLAFDDEFDGSSLDLTKWQPNWLAGGNTAITKPPNSDDLNCMDPRQVSETGGALMLTAAQRSCTANNGVTYGYASGLVNTYSSFQFTYGYIEARMYLPATNGLPANFPAFWADGTGTWPSTGELDVMEVLRSCGPGVGYHFHSTAGAPGSCVSLSNASGWHTFGAYWQPGSVTYYYDGKAVGSITSGITSAPMYLILNNSVDPTFGGATATPAAVQVDYVRVWR